MKNINEKLYNFQNKQAAFNNYLFHSFNKTARMFKYEGLPDTIPAWIAERTIQFNGFTVVTSIDDKLYTLWGGLGGEPDIYYNPTVCTINNPHFPKETKQELKIGEECIIVKNDTWLLGMLPIYRRFATLFVENDITLRRQDINSRAMLTFAADNDSSKKSAEIFLKKLEDGDLSVIAGDEFLEGIKSIAVNAQNSRITDTIEYRQYIEAKLNNAIGLASNYNMKREHLNAAETDLTDDIVPNIEDMLQCRVEGWAAVNSKYGTNVKVTLNEPWFSNRSERLIDENDKASVSDNVKRYIYGITGNKSEFTME